jgi:VIT1/CCC1 family predicted Fe2+/Mn2+ transporter
MSISEKSLKVIRKMQQNEITESVIYKKIAKFAKGQENKETLLRLSSEEAAHANIWKSYTNEDVKPNKFKVFKYTLIARLFGFTFAVKLMEHGELDAQNEYASIADEVPESVHIQEQEKEHEESLLAMLDEEKLNYVGSMVLGMNDALVELTGALAGFTFAMQDTKLIALAGLIIGISATFSMAASEFLSARQEGRSDAFKSCLYTGTAYLATVALLILPYLVLSTGMYIIALGWMLAMVVAEIAIFTFYISVAKDEKFKPKFLEMSIISISVAVLSFGVSIAAKAFLGVDI